MNERTEENVMREPLHKTRALWKMAEGRFASVYSVEEFILEHENKNTAQKTERDVRLLERFLKTKDEDRKIEDIPAAELNEFISEFIISVRTKDGNEYEPTSLRSLMASFERHLKKKGYSASIINDLVFEKTRKVLQFKQKQLKKQGKGNKLNYSAELLFKVVIFPFISTK